MLKLLLILLCSASLLAEPIRIALLTDLSGDGAYVGTQTRNGAILAAAELNNEKIALKLFIGDHQLDPRKAVTEIKKAVNINKVDAIYSEFSGPSVAAANAIKNEKIPLIYAGAATSILRTYPYSFKTFADFAIGCNLLINKLLERKNKKIAFMHNQIESTEVCLQSIKKVHKDIEVFYYQLRDDLSSYALKLKNKKIDAVINMGYEMDLMNFYKRLDEIKYYPTLGVYRDSFAQGFLGKYSKLENNTYYFDYLKAKPEIIDKFIKRFSNSNPLTIDFSLIAYLHIKQLYHAIKNCGKDIDCQMKHIEDSKSEPDFDFNGFKNRKAIFTTYLGTFKQ